MFDCLMHVCASLQPTQRVYALDDEDDDEDELEFEG